MSLIFSSTGNKKNQKLSAQVQKVSFIIISLKKYSSRDTSLSLSSNKKGILRAEPVRFCARDSDLLFLDDEDYEKPAMNAFWLEVYTWKNSFLKLTM